ncbi:MAG: hypothetical protein GMKNLPBB_02474 [Myxococcota bacterium]|nr:hypothetical protein [Myxococcota bacterium]
MDDGKGAARHGRRLYRKRRWRYGSLGCRCKGDTGMRHRWYREITVIIGLLAALAMAGCSSAARAPTGSGGDLPDGGIAGPAADSGSSSTDSGAADSTPNPNPADSGVADTGPPAGGGPKEIPGAKNIFEIPDGDFAVDSFYKFPFPSDLRKRPEGTISLRGFPNPHKISLLDNYRKVMQDTITGWGANQGGYFGFDGALDESSLPSDPARTLAKDAPVFLINVDPKSSMRGAKLPVLAKFVRNSDPYVAANTLILIPHPGFAMEPGRQYAYVITRAVKGSNGQPLGSSLAFEQVKAAQDPGIPAFNAVRALYQPVLNWMESENIVNRSDIAAMTVFTVQDAVSEMFRVGDFIRRNLPPPQARNLKFERTANSFQIYAAEFPAAQFQKGPPPFQNEDSGYFQFGKDGEPVVDRTENIRIAITVPTSKAPDSGWPVALYAHGTGGDYKSHINDGTADVLARNGVASIGLDGPLHGPRNPTSQPVELLFFNFTNARAGRDNVRQGAADTLQLFQMAKRFNIPAPVNPAKAEIRFNPAKILYAGHSQGGLTGPLFLAAERECPGGLLSGAGGGFALALLQKVEPVNILEIAAALLKVRSDELDAFHPAVQLLTILTDPADPVNYAPYWIDRAAGKPQHVLMTEGLQDTFTPPDSIEALAVAGGLEQVGPVARTIRGLALKGLSTGLKRPAGDNRKGPDGTTASGFILQYPNDGHFAIMRNNNAKTDYGMFMRSLAYDGAGRLEN